MGIIKVKYSPTAMDSFLCVLSWPFASILTTNEFYTQHSRNLNRNVGMETINIWTSNVSSVFFRFSLPPPITENLLRAPKHLGIQSFPCPLPNYLKHIQLENRNTTKANPYNPLEPLSLSSWNSINTMTSNVLFTSCNAT